MEQVIKSYPAHDNGFVSELLQSTAYALVTEPLTAAAQLVDAVADTHLQSSSQVIGEPQPAKLGTAGWVAQTLGSAIGALPWIVGIGYVTKGAFNAGDELGLSARRSALRLSVPESTVVGFASGLMLHPAAGSGSQFWANKLLGGLSGAATFGAMSGSSIALSKLSRSSLLSESTFGSILQKPVANGIAAGIPAGLIDTLSQSLSEKHKLPGLSEVSQSVASMSLIGLTFGALASSGGYEGSPIRKTTEVIGNTLKDSENSTPWTPVVWMPKLESWLVKSEVNVDSQSNSVYDRLTIKRTDEPLEQVMARIHRMDNVTIDWDYLPESAPVRYDDMQELYNNLETRKREMRRYTVDGLDTEIFVPEEYGRLLDDSNSQGEYSTRARPEDIVRELDQLPNSSIVKFVFLTDENSVRDAYFQQFNPDDAILASATTDGVIGFHRANAADLKVAVPHEWAHIVEATFPENFILYKLALQLENGWNARPYAEVSDEENWAVMFGEQLLNPDYDEFEIAALEAPIRSSVLAQALEEVMYEQPEDRDIPNEPQLAGRIQYIRNISLPWIQDRLLSEVDSDNSERKNAATRLLAALAPASGAPQSAKLT
ncbi:MAG TPA: hypothetical protein V6C72_06410 [Chroococcales cyanobacterium]